MAFVNVISPNGLVQPDPNKQLQGFASAQNALNQNTEWKQKNANRLALAQAYQDATDPNTGVVDNDAFKKSVLLGPDTSMFAASDIQDNQETQGKQYGLNAAGQTQAQSRLAVAAGYGAPMLAKDPSTVTPADVYTAVAQAHANGLNTDGLSAEIARTMPQQDPDNPTDPATYGKNLQGWFRGLMSGSGLNTSGQQSEYTPNVQLEDFGGSKQGVDMSPITHPGIVGQTFGKTLTPEGAVSPVTGPVGPGGAPTTIPLGTFAQKQGYGGLVAGGGPDGGQGAPAPGAVTTQPLGAPGQGGGKAAPPASPFANGGRYQIPSALRNPNGPAAGGVPSPQGSGAGPAFNDPTIYPSGDPGAASPSPNAPAPPDSVQPPPMGGNPVPPPAPPGPPAMAGGAPASGGTPAPMVTGMAPGIADARAKLYGDNVNQALALEHSTDGIKARQAIYAGMQGDLTEANTGNVSPITDAARGRFVQFGQTLGIPMGGLAANQSANENFSKLANQLVMQSSSQLGAMTNDKLAVSELGNPNPHYSKAGNLGVIHVLQGNDDALQTKANAWAQAKAQGTPPESYNDWSTRFNQNFSITPFWFARMGTDERTRFLAGMDGTQKAQLWDGIKTSIKSGWIPQGMFLPQGQQIAQAGQ